jgi:zinc transporter 1
MSPMASQETLSRNSMEIGEQVQSEQPRETQNGRLARLGRCLHEFGIQRVTLQIEDDPEKAK